MIRIVSTLACIVMLATSAFAQNSASFDIFRDADLFKISSHTTDSVTFKLEGSVVTITCEIREAFRTRPTRRLQMTIPAFHGVGQYDPTTGAVTYWENFTKNEMCACFDHAVNDITITKYDSAKKVIEGTFNWKCESFSTGSGEQINYRVRNGAFAYGEQSKIALSLTPADSLKIGTLQNDTTINVVIAAKKGQDPLEGVKISVNDKTVDATTTFTEKGTTNANGEFTYALPFKKNTPSGQYVISVVGEKDNFRKSDTAKLTITYGDRYWYYQCAGINVLEFDAGEGKKWAPVSEGSTTIKASGTITVGGAIKIDGTVRINTKEGEQKVFVDGGRVYIPDVRFATDDVGDLDLTNILTGSDMPLPNCDGIISLATEAASKKLSKKLPGNVEVKLKEFKIINRADAKGISIKGSISLQNARTGCDEVIDSTGGFDITEDPRAELGIGVSVTNTNGFENFSFDAGNISLTSAFCLNQFSVNADFVNKVYALAGKITFPVKGNDLTLGAKVLFKNNPANPDNKLHFDSLEASLELGDCKLIPETPLCFNSAAFSTSGWSNPTANGRAIRATVVLQSAEQVVLDKFPWVKNVFGDPAFAEIEGTLEYRHPLIFTGSITSRMIRIKAISAAKPWQLEGNHTATIDLNNNIGISGSYKIGHLGLDDYFLSATGSLTYFWKPTLGLSANVAGAVRIPGAGDDILDMDYIGTAMRFMMLSGFIPTSLGTAQASLLVNEDNGLAINASVDVTQNPIDYIRSFGRMSVSYTYKNGVPTLTTKSDTIRTVPPMVPKAGDEVQEPAQPLDTISVDNSVDRMFIMISGSGSTAAPASTLTGPDGTSYTASSQDSSVLRFATPNGEIVQWSVINPEEGAWILALNSPKTGDQVEVSYNRKPQPLSIEASAAGRVVNVTWDPLMSASDASIAFYLDNDATGTNGVYVGQAQASAGTYSYTLPSDMTECTYYVHATRNSTSQGIVTAYAPQALKFASTSGIVIPAEVTANSNQFGRTSVQWRIPAGTSADGFLVYVINEDGTDSVYATAFGGERMAMIDIQNHANKKIAVAAFNSQGVRGCRTEAIAIVTGVKEAPLVGATHLGEVSIVPNPVSSIAAIRYKIDSEVRSIDVVDAFGNRITQLQSEASGTGWNQVLWDANEVASGSYYIRINTVNGTAVAKIVVVR